MSHIDYSEWELVIGLEIHVQLKTKSKLFSSAPNHFGDEPNVNIGAVDTGQPGLCQYSIRKLSKKPCSLVLPSKALLPEQALLTVNPIFIQIVPVISKYSIFSPDHPRWHNYMRCGRNY